MPYLILAMDHAGKDELRESLRQQHRAHLKSAGARLLGSGALLDDEGKQVIGGLSILDSDDLDEANRFAFEDPYSTAGIRKDTRVIRWRRRWINGEFLGDKRE
jgi:uncharacterized protein YciI